MSQNKDKIVNVRLYTVLPRWLFVRIETESGIVGWGEPMIEGQGSAVRSQIEHWLGIKDLIIGADSRNVNRLLCKLTTGTFYNGSHTARAAIAGIDMALWDIAGKRANLPCYEMWGGAVCDLDGIPGYTWLPENDFTAERGAELISRMYADGCRFFKMNACSPIGFIDTTDIIKQAAERMRRAREAAPDARIALDWHGRLHWPEVRRAFAAVDQYEVFFHEEPVLPDAYRYLAQVAQATNNPIALGERLVTEGQFRAALETGGVQILQVDLSHVGPTMGRKIFELAEAFDVGCTCHAPLGPLNGRSSHMVGCTSRTYQFQERSDKMQYGKEAGSADRRPVEAWDYLTPDSAAGYALNDQRRLVLPTSGAGWCLEIDEAKVTDADAAGHKWHDFLNAGVTAQGQPTEW